MHIRLIITCCSSEWQFVQPLPVLFGNDQIKAMPSGALSELRLIADLQENRHALALLAADLSANAAKGLGLSYTDKSAKSGNDYVYRLRLENNKEGFGADTVYYFVQYDGTNELVPQVQSVVTEAKHAAVDVYWDKEFNRNFFTAYYVERSENKKDWAATATYGSFISVFSSHAFISRARNLPNSLNVSLLNSYGQSFSSQSALSSIHPLRAATCQTENRAGAHLSITPSELLFPIIAALAETEGKSEGCWEKPDIVPTNNTASRKYSIRFIYIILIY